MKFFMLILVLYVFVCNAEDYILQNHKNLHPYEIIHKIEVILNKPPNFRTKEDLAKQQQYLDLYKKNMELAFPIKKYSMLWDTYYSNQQLLFFMEEKYHDAKKLALGYVDALKPFSNLYIQDILFLVYQDLSYCYAIFKDKIKMEEYIQKSKCELEKMKQWPCENKKERQKVLFIIQLTVIEQEIKNYAVLKEWDHVFSLISAYIKKHGTEIEFEKNSYVGYIYTYLTDYYKHKKKYSKAEYYAVKANYATRRRKFFYLSNCIFLAKRYYKTQRYQKSLDLCELVLLHMPGDWHLTPRDFDWVERVQLLLTAAKCYAALGQKEKCLEYLNQAEAKSKDPAIHKQIQSIRDKTEKR